jgi:hypothetical protein
MDNREAEQQPTSDGLIGRSEAKTSDSAITEKAIAFDLIISLVAQVNALRGENSALRRVIGSYPQVAGCKSGDPTLGDVGEHSPHRRTEPSAEEVNGSLRSSGRSRANG